MKKPLKEQMSEVEAAQVLAGGFEVLCNYARFIAMFPIEDWIEMFEKTDSFGCVIDPTMWREYINSPSTKILKKILPAALELKRVVLSVQPEVVQAMVERKMRENADA